MAMEQASHSHRPLSKAGKDVAVEWQNNGTAKFVSSALTNRSMHETSCRTDMWSQPDMKALDVLRVALDADVARQQKKYGDTEPNIGSARFHVALPTTPQHRKYSWRPRSDIQGAGLLLAGSPQGTDGGPPSPSSSGVHSSRMSPGRNDSSVRFDKRTLRQWFTELDRADSGYITKRALVVHLRQRPDIQAALRIGDTPGQTQRQVARQIQDLIDDVDEDGKGSMNWDEFTSFFRNAGVLLEYNVDRQLDGQNELSENIRFQRTSHRQGLGEDAGVSDALAAELRVAMGKEKEQRFRHRRVASIES